MSAHLIPTAYGEHASRRWPVATAASPFRSGTSSSVPRLTLRCPRATTSKYLVKVHGGTPEMSGISAGVVRFGLEVEVPTQLPKA